MDFAVSNGDVPDGMDDPYVALKLQADSKAYLDSAYDLIYNIKQSLPVFHEQKQLITSGAFQDEGDLEKANSYLKELDAYLRSLCEMKNQMTTNVPKNFHNFLNFLLAEFAGISSEKFTWNHLQRLVLMGAPDDIVQSCPQTLKQLKEKFEQMESQIVVLRQQIEAYLEVIDELITVSPTCEQHTSQCGSLASAARTLLDDINKLSVSLLNRGTIILQQPPFIVRRCGNTNGKHKQKSKIPFDMKIREQQAKNIVEGKINPTREKITPAGVIKYQDSVLNVNCEGYLQADIVSASIQSVEKEETDDASKIMYHILFLAKYEQPMPNGSPHYLPCWAISLPFSVVINANRQDKYKTARMFWQIAFGIDDKTSLAVHTDEASERNGKVPWPKFFTALNYWFKQTVSENTKIKITRGLEEQENYIKNKIGLTVSTTCVNGDFVTWEMFYKRKSDPHRLTFWEWLYPAADYISSKCATAWENGFVAGFMSRQLAEQKLAESDVPTMILKFSDSRPGKIAASFTDTINGVTHVMLDEDDTPIYADKNLIECVRCSVKLHGVKKILPVGKSLTDLYQLERPTSGSPLTARKLPPGYSHVGVVVVLPETPKEPVYTNPRTLNVSNIQSQDAISQISPSLSSLSPYLSIERWLNPSERSQPSTSGRTSQESQHSTSGNSPHSSVFEPPVGLIGAMADWGIHDWNSQQSPLLTPQIEHGNPWPVLSPQMVQNHDENGQVQGDHGLCQNQPMQIDQADEFLYQDQNVYQPAMQQNGHQPFAQQMLQQNGNQPLAQQMNGQHALQNGNSPPPNPFTTRSFTMNAEAHQSSHFNGQLFEGM